MGVSAEIYTHEKATFRERIAALAGRSTWREPMEGHSTDPAKMTDQDVAAALAYARQGPDDIGPDIAYCMICGSDWHRARIVRLLAEALASSGHAWRGARPYTLTIADQAFRSVVWQERVCRPEGCPERVFGNLLLAGVAALHSQADEAIRRAEAAFRKNS
jgi:hypothetical protein